MLSNDTMWPPLSSAKGRTNIELREQFILAHGVAQSMTPFKSKPHTRSPTSSQSGSTSATSWSGYSSSSASGPIMKVSLSHSLCTTKHHFHISRTLLIIVHQTVRTCIQQSLTLTFLVNYSNTSSSLGPVVGRRPQHALSMLACCAVLCQIVSLQYLSRSSLHRLAGLPCRLCLSHRLQVVTP